MNHIDCPHHSEINGQPVCEIVHQITDRPLAECLTNDGACQYCLGCGIAPQRPNPATASMAIGAANRTGDRTFAAHILGRMGPYLNRAEPVPTACVLRGSEIRVVQCKPCQAGSLTVVTMPVFDCPIHNECSLHNTGVHPRIHACSTCSERREA